jgi:hypothetical protein
MKICRSLYGWACCRANCLRTCPLVQLFFGDGPSENRKYTLVFVVELGKAVLDKHTQVWRTWSKVKSNLHPRWERQNVLSYSAWISWQSEKEGKIEGGRFEPVKNMKTYMHRLCRRSGEKVSPEVENRVTYLCGYQDRLSGPASIGRYAVSWLL